MRGARWMGVVVLVAIAPFACGQPVAVREPPARTASAPRNEPVIGSGSSQPAPCPATQPLSSSASNRNLEVVWLKGSTCYVVRDITDILHPVNVAASEKFREPQFVSSTELSFIDGHLVKMRLPGSRTDLPEGGSPYAWSPDGTTVAFMTSVPGSATAELHVQGPGQSRIVGSVPALKGGVGCTGLPCADQWDFRLLFSPSGASISLGQMPVGVLRIWTAGGKLLKSVDSASVTMSVWSGNSFFWRDDKGVEVWRDGAESLALPGVAWVRPRASSRGQVVYEARDAEGTAHVYLLDPSSLTSRELAQSRSEPAFLNSHLIWYKEERRCKAGEACVPGGKTIETGKTYIYDLDDKTETESIIQAVFDVWPHPA